MQLTLPTYNKVKDLFQSEDLIDLNLIASLYKTLLTKSIILQTNFNSKNKTFELSNDRCERSKDSSTDIVDATRPQERLR